MMIILIILAGSSALSKRSVTFAAIMSRVRENMPITPNSCPKRRSPSGMRQADRAGQLRYARSVQRLSRSNRRADGSGAEDHRADSGEDDMLNFVLAEHVTSPCSSIAPQRL